MGPLGWDGPVVTGRASAAASSPCISWRSWRPRAPSGSSSTSTRGRLTRAWAKAAVDPLDALGPGAP
jgi:hypothetical protein